MTYKNQSIIIISDILKKAKPAKAGDAKLRVCKPNKVMIAGSPVVFLLNLLLSERLLGHKFPEAFFVYRKKRYKIGETTAEYSDSERIKEIWALFKETDKRFQETDKEIKETSKSVREIGRRVDALTGKWGRFVEGLVVPGMISMFESRGIEIERIFTRIKAKKNGGKMEIDILGVNGEYAVLVEVKSTLSVDDVKEHIDRLKEFKRFFPEYAERKVAGAVAGIVIEGGADKFAYRQGLFVIAQTGESVAIVNDSGFKPKVW